MILSDVMLEVNRLDGLAKNMRVMSEKFDNALHNLKAELGDGKVDKLGGCGEAADIERGPLPPGAICKVPNVVFTSEREVVAACAPLICMHCGEGIEVCDKSVRCQECKGYVHSYNGMHYGYRSQGEGINPEFGCIAEPKHVETPQHNCPFLGECFCPKEVMPTDPDQGSIPKTVGSATPPASPTATSEVGGQDIDKQFEGMATDEEYQKEALEFADPNYHGTGIDIPKMHHEYQEKLLSEKGKELMNPAKPRRMKANPEISHFRSHGKEHDYAPGGCEAKPACEPVEAPRRMKANPAVLGYEHREEHPHYPACGWEPACEPVEEPKETTAETFWRGWYDKLILDNSRLKQEADNLRAELSQAKAKYTELDRSWDARAGILDKQLREAKERIAELEKAIKDGVEKWLEQITEHEKDLAAEKAAHQAMAAALNEHTKMLLDAMGKLSAWEKRAEDFRLHTVELCSNKQQMTDAEFKRWIYDTWVKAPYEREGE